jgi:hypothetical protein
MNHAYQRNRRRTGPFLRPNYPEARRTGRGQQLARGCPDGRPPKQDALPLGVLGPQVSVRLLEQLEARSGRFHTGAAIPVSAPVRNAMCSR